MPKITVLNETMGKGYAHVRKKFLEKFNEIDESNISTLHVLTSSHPGIERLAFEKELALDDNISNEEEENGFEINNNAAQFSVNHPNQHLPVCQQGYQYNCTVTQGRRK